MKRTSKTKRPISAESIARLADKGEDMSSYFTNKGKMMPPLEIDINEDVIRKPKLEEREGTGSRP